MANVENLDQMDVKELLDLMNSQMVNDRIPGTFETARTAIQLRSISALTKTIDQLRESSDKASASIKTWTKVLAGATIVLAIATIILALK